MTLNSTPDEIDRATKAFFEERERIEKAVAPLKKRLVLAEDVIFAVMKEMDWELHPKVKAAILEWRNKR